VGKVCSPLEEGGPGIKNLRAFNMDLVGKWVWKIKSKMLDCGIELWLADMGREGRIWGR